MRLSEQGELVDSRLVCLGAVSELGFDVLILVRSFCFKEFLLVSFPPLLGRPGPGLES